MGRVDAVVTFDVLLETNQDIRRVATAIAP
jgi:hypothetical protein